MFEKMKKVGQGMAHFEKKLSFSKPDPYLYGRLGQPSLIDLLYKEKKNGFFVECKAVHFYYHG